MTHAVFGVVLLQVIMCDMSVVQSI